ncbi:MAG: type IV pilus modification protein PilV [Burkholderiaceae bacterium]
MCWRTQKGFTLAEVLASVFLLAIGLVGAAGMQLQALRTAQQSAFHTVALSLAAEMADMMRMTLSSDSSQALIAQYLQVDFSSETHSMREAADCYRMSCDTAQLVEFEIEQWMQRIETSLPGARAKVCVDAQPWSADTGRPDWMCRSSVGQNGKEHGAIVVKIGWHDKAVPLDSRAEGKTAQEFPPLLVMTVAPYVQ